MKKVFVIFLAIVMMLGLSSCAFLALSHAPNEKGSLSDIQESVIEHGLSTGNGEVEEATKAPTSIVEALETGIPQDMIDEGIEALLDDPDDVWESTSPRGETTLSNIEYECAFYFEGNGLTHKSVYLVYHMDVKYENEGFESLEGSIYHAVEFDNSKLNGNGIIVYDDVETDCHNGSMESLKSKNLAEGHGYHEVFRFGQGSVQDLRDYYEDLLGGSYEITYIP